VLTGYAYLASHARQMFSSGSAIQKLNRFAGGVMMATGVAIASKF
jgi:threonine/homoserine/homoserine lactone efflux protein